MAGKHGIGIRVGGFFGYISAQYDPIQFAAQINNSGVEYVIVGVGAFGGSFAAPHSILTTLSPASTPRDAGVIGKGFGPGGWDGNADYNQPGYDVTQLPDRDIYAEVITALNNVNIKTILLFATEGPAALTHGESRQWDYNNNSPYVNTTAECPNLNDTDLGLSPIPTDKPSECSPIVRKWRKYVRDTFPYNNTFQADIVGTLKKAYAELVIGEFAQRYTTNVSGYWFDHADWGDGVTMEQVIHNENANPDAVIGWNDGGKNPLRNNNPGIEDFTAGHVTPVPNGPSDGCYNYGMVLSAESSINGYVYDNLVGQKDNITLDNSAWGGGNGDFVGVYGLASDPSTRPDSFVYTADDFPSKPHVFMPLNTKWNSGDQQWGQLQAQEWMKRVLDAGGAWTWNVKAEPTYTKVNDENWSFLQQVYAGLPGGSNPITADGTEANPYHYDDTNCQCCTTIPKGSYSWGCLHLTDYPLDTCSANLGLDNVTSLDTFAPTVTPNYPCPWLETDDPTEWVFILNPDGTQNKPCTGAYFENNKKNRCQWYGNTTAGNSDPTSGPTVGEVCVNKCGCCTWWDGTTATFTKENLSPTAQMPQYYPEHWCPEYTVSSPTTPAPTPPPTASSIPSRIPSNTPSDQPSHIPSNNPSDVPSQVPSNTPSDPKPSNNPSDVPSHAPSDLPSSVPSAVPTVAMNTNTTYEVGFMFGSNRRKLESNEHDLIERKLTCLSEEFNSTELDIVKTSIKSVLTEEFSQTVLITSIDQELVDGCSIEITVDIAFPDDTTGDMTISNITDIIDDTIATDLVETITNAGLNNIGTVSVTGVGPVIDPESLNKFSWDIFYQGAGVTFSDESGKEEIKLGYNTSLRARDVVVYDYENCNSTVDSSVIFVKTNMKPTSSSHGTLDVLLDVEQDAIVGSNVWFNGTSPNTNHILLCVRVDLTDKIDPTDPTLDKSVSFHEVKLNITIDMTQGFDVTDIQSDRDDATVTNETASLNYTVLAYPCTSSTSGDIQSTMPPLAQGDVCTICVETNATDVFVATITEMSFVQGTTTYEAITGGDAQGLTSLDCQDDEVCVTKTQMISAFFDEAIPDPVNVIGECVMAFGSSRRLTSVGTSLRSLQDTDVINEPFNVQVELQGNTMGENAIEDTADADVIVSAAAAGFDSFINIIMASFVSIVSAFVFFM